MDDEDKPRRWVTVLKTGIVVVVLIILIGLGLFYTAKFDTYSPDHKPTEILWGIAKDSPIFNQR